METRSENRGSWWTTVVHRDRSTDVRLKPLFVLPADRLQDATQGAEANGLHLWRIVFVGKKRVLLEWGTEVRSATKDIILETDSRVDQWYALACVPAGT